MNILFKIALRNLVRHKAKSLIIGIIIALGMFILVIGNSITDTAAAGLKKAFIDSYTGHIMISAKPKDVFEQISILGKSGTSGTTATPVLPDYQQILEYIKGQPEVVAYTPQITGIGILGSEDKKPALAILFGIEPATYKAMFNNINIIEGSYLLPEETGIMLSQKTHETLEAKLGKIEIGDTVLINTPMSMGLKIREEVVRAIFTLKSPGSIPYEMALMDALTLRALTGMNIGGSREVKLDAADTEYLSADESDLFSGGDLVDSSVKNGAQAGHDIAALLKEGGPVITESDTWNFILVRLKSEKDIKPVLARLNVWFSKNGIEARAQNWVAASGGLASTAQGFKFLLNIIIIIIGVVAVIIIMNTLVISVMERTTEIGMMRALGTQKGFIWKMLITETMLISIAFGLAGMVLGCLVIGILNLVGLQTDNQILSLILGGNTLRPQLSPAGLIQPLLAILLIGIISQFYPSHLALKIRPIEAIQKE